MSVMCSIDEPYELIVPGVPKSLSLIRMLVSTVAESAGLKQEQIDKIIVAVDEACTNVIEHGYKKLKPHPPVEIIIHVDGKDFLVDIVDSGPAFALADRELNKFPDHWMDGQDNMRGAGLYLMMALMDTVDYTKMPDDRNRMRMIKRID